MKKLTTADTILTAHHYRNILRAEGIDCEVRNEHFGSAMGNIPLGETGPQLWVVNDLDYDRALELIQQSTQADHAGPTWVCKSCGESNDGQFAACWNCGTPDEP